MDNMVTVQLFGKKHKVPDNLTIMRAIEYAGYKLIKGCGCRNGFCGACTAIYRISETGTPTICLACQTMVEEDMYVAALPTFPIEKQVYDIDELSTTQQIIKQLYPEIYSCIGCNSCTKACPQGIDVMKYIKYAQNGEFQKCAEESFECVMCGACTSRCPVKIHQPQIAMLARRINGKYIAPKSKDLQEKLEKIKNGEYEDMINALINKSADEIKELYEKRDIEK